MIMAKQVATHIVYIASYLFTRYPDLQKTMYSPSISCSASTTWVRTYMNISSHCSERYAPSVATPTGSPFRSQGEPSVRQEKCRDLLEEILEIWQEEKPVPGSGGYFQQQIMDKVMLSNKLRSREAGARLRDRYFLPRHFWCDQDWQVNK